VTCWQTKEIYNTEGERNGKHSYAEAEPRIECFGPGFRDFSNFHLMLKICCNTAGQANMQ
jgi:hypothetical protein